MMSTTFIDNKDQVDIIVGDGDTVVISRGRTMRVFDDGVVEIREIQN